MSDYPTEYLELNNVELNDLDKYWIENLGPLHQSATRLGTVEQMAYRKGGMIWPHRDGWTELAFELFIAGATWDEHDTNENDIRTNVVGTHDEDGFIVPVTGIWHRNSGDQWAADVLVKGIYEPELDSEHPPTMKYNLVVVVDGWFEATGS